jgi:hypothetical protein
LIDWLQDIGLTLNPQPTTGPARNPRRFSGAYYLSLVGLFQRTLLRLGARSVRRSAGGPMRLARAENGRFPRALAGPASRSLKQTHMIALSATSPARESFDQTRSRPFSACTVRLKMVWPAKCVSSWEIEWITLPGIFTLAGGTLAQACFVLEKLEVNADTRRAPAST